MSEHAEKTNPKEASFFWSGIGKKLRYAFIGSAVAAAAAAWYFEIRTVSGVAGCFLAIHLVLMYFVGLVVVRDDKRRAGSNEWRVPENTILAIAAAGGSIGVLRGMYKYRHKTKHAKFYLGVPLILLAQILLVAYLFFPRVFARIIGMV